MNEEHDDGAPRRHGRKDRPDRDHERDPIPTSPRDATRRRLAPGPKPRHFLDDEDDRALAKYFGSGRERARAADRGAARLAAAVRRHVLVVLHGGADPATRDAVSGDPREPDTPWPDLRLVAVDVGRGGAALSVTFAVAQGEEPSSRALAARLAAALRAELAAHVPRRRTPEVRVRLVAEDQGGLRGEEDPR